METITRPAARLRLRPAAFLAACLAALAACDQGPEESLSQSGERLPWNAFRDNFIERSFEEYPRNAVRAGRHEYDGLLSDMSPQAIAARIAWLEEERAGALEYPVAELPGPAAFEREYLVSTVDLLLFELEDSGFVAENPVIYAQGIDPTVYLTREYAPLATRMAAFAAHAENIPAYFAQMRANLSTPLARPHVEVSKSILSGMAAFFAETVPGIFADVDDAGLQNRLAVANARAIAALEETLTWLDAQELDDDFALGEQRFATMLRMMEGVDVPLADLKAAGESDLDRNRRMLIEACSEFAPGASPIDCVARAEANKPQGGPVEGARQQLPRLKQFLIDNDLVSIPGTEEALVDEAPSYRRTNIAYIMIPGPWEQGLPSTYYIAPPDPAWSEQDRLDYLPGEKKLLYISVHEVWPGHFLQFLHANRSDSVFGRLFYTYSNVEGWAHYAEELMFDAGLDDGNLESRIGQLSNALLRNVRYLSAIGLHTEGMTVDESRRMFEEVGMQDYGNAIQQAQRGTYDPGYLNYTLGKLMIRKLRDDWTAARGGRGAWKEFHDAFLAYGGPPIPLIRSDMLGDDAAGDDALLAD